MRKALTTHYALCIVPDMRTASAIIDALGGTTAVAAALSPSDERKVSYQTVHSWRARGFPANRALEIRNLAVRLDLGLTLEEILTAPTEAAAHNGQVA